MKNIIVPTDFSACADNALRYAVSLAKELTAKLHIVYAYSTENTLDDQISISAEYRKMDGIKESLANDKDLIFECYTKEGSLDNVLIQLTEKEKAGLIVIGTQGAHDNVKVKISNDTFKVIEREKIAVLSVPETFTGTLSPKSEFILATDFELTPDWSAMDPFYELALKLHANINVFYNKENPSKDIKEYEKEVFGELVAFFKGINVSLHNSSKDNIVTATDDFAKAKNASLVMMIAHEHGWLSELFHHSVTKDMTLHGHVPLLTIPEGEAELNKAYNVGYW